MSNDTVVFIRGTGRCGSKNLVRHLGTHRHLAHVPVNQVLPEDLIDWSRHRLQADDPRITDDAIVASCRAYFNAYGRSLAGPSGYLLQKSTMNAHHLATLLDFWPEARVVYLMRHPIGVVEALINADIHDYRGEYGYCATVADSLLRWYNELNTYRNSPAYENPRLLPVQFEDLIADTESVVDAICDFIGIERMHLAPYGEPERHETPFVLSNDERRWIIESTADLLTQLGYDPHTCEADYDHQQPTSSPDLYPERRLTARPPALDGVELVRMAMEEAAQRGQRRVGLYGAGYFSRMIIPQLIDMPVELVAIFDDNASIAHRRIGAYPILRTETALDMHVDAVIPATFVHQEKLIRRWRRLIGTAVPILPLWHDEPASLPVG